MKKIFLGIVIIITTIIIGVCLVRIFKKTEKQKYKEGKINYYWLNKKCYKCGKKVIYARNVNKLGNRDLEKELGLKQNSIDFFCKDVKNGKLQCLTCGLK